MKIRPITPELLVGELADRLDDRGHDRWVRVAIDGPAAAVPERLADALVAALRVRGRPALSVRAADFLRPASLRYEYGRRNPDAFYVGWLDEAGLRREVLDRLAPDGPGTVLPSLWDPDTDRATRAAYVSLPPGGVVIVSGPLLLGGGLPFDFTVHLVLSAGALARRTAPSDAWTLPAFARYADEVLPATFADLVVRMDDPRHPAVVESGG